MQSADWSIQLCEPEELYQALLIDGCVRSGLYQLLLVGAAPEHFSQFDSRLLRAVLPALESRGLIQRQGADMVWVNSEAVSRALYLSQHLRVWLDLARQLNPTIAGDRAPRDDVLGLAALDRSAPLLAQWIVQAADVRREQRWLDVGAGSGLLGEHLARHTGEVILCDRPDVVDHWNNRQWPHNVRTLALNILDEDVPGLFDGVLLCRFVELLAPENARRLFGKLRQVLRPHGTLCLVGYFSPQAPLYDLFRVQVALHVNEGYVYSLSELRDLASDAQFEATTACVQQWHGYDLICLKVPATEVEPSLYAGHESIRKSG